MNSLIFVRFIVQFSLLLNFVRITCGCYTAASLGLGDFGLVDGQGGKKGFDRKAALERLLSDGRRGLTANDWVGPFLLIKSLI